jgi:hypothetical protein
MDTADHLSDAIAFLEAIIRELERIHAEHAPPPPEDKGCERCIVMLSIAGELVRVARDVRTGLNYFDIFSAN